MPLLQGSNINDFRLETKRPADDLSRQVLGQQLSDMFPQEFVQTTIRLLNDHKNEDNFELESIGFGFVKNDFPGVQFIVGENCSKYKKELILVNALNELNRSYSGQKSSINIHDDKGDNAVELLISGDERKYVIAHNPLYME